MEFDKELNIVMTREEFLSQHRAVEAILSQIDKLNPADNLELAADLIALERAIKNYLEDTNSALRKLLGIPQAIYLPNGKTLNN